MTTSRRANRCSPKSDRQGLKLMLFGGSSSIVVVAAATLLLLQHFQFSQSALLTNIYGKNLSELTDISHRFLLIPSNSIAANGGAGDDEQLGFETADFQTNSSLAQDEEQLPSPAALVSAPAPQVWKQQQANKAKLVMVQQSGNNVSGGANPDGAQQATTRLPAGEPQVLESVSTEFPNPNINNLGHEITKILRKFFLHGYDKRVRPNYSGPPALVNVSFHIIGISSVDEVQMDFTTDFYFRQKWFDPRLEFDPVGNIDELCVGAEFAEKIWLPDTFFANEKTATFHKATTENTFIRIGTTGRVYRSIRLTVTCSCPMDLQYFPMDRQRCKIEIESYGYNTRDIDYRWERGDASVSLNTKIELPQFKILGFKMGQEIQNLSSGDYIRLYCEIHFVRSMGYYLFQIYIPASLIVMISWVSFWLHRNATPARVALGVTTVLTMTTLMSSTNAALPKISYIKSIDVFLGTCFVMVFAALLEYASVGYIGKRIAMKRKRLQDLHQMQQHHQKVCVAAAASAAAAAAASSNQSDLTLGRRTSTTAKFAPTGRTGPNRPPNVFQFGSAFQHASGAQTLSRSLNMDSNGATGSGSRTLRRVSNMNGLDQDYNDDPNYGQGSGCKVVSADQVDLGQYQQNGSARNRFSSNHHQLDQNKPLVAAGAAIAAAAAANSAHGTTAEFEVNQAHDLIRICGLTPSAIDKHSRVVFPICFVCFNLMYWIIYGHISQQVEDKGPPLIPFIKS